MHKTRIGVPEVNSSIHILSLSLASSARCAAVFPCAASDWRSCLHCWIWRSGLKFCIKYVNVPAVWFTWNICSKAHCFISIDAASCQWSHTCVSLLRTHVQTTSHTTCTDQLTGFQSLCPQCPCLLKMVLAIPRACQCKVATFYSLRVSAHKDTIVNFWASNTIT